MTEFEEKLLIQLEELNTKLGMLLTPPVVIEAKESKELMQFIRENITVMQPGSVIPVTKNQMELLRLHPFVRFYPPKISDLDTEEETLS